MAPFPEDELEPRILYEDRSLVAAMKPPRMHSAPGLGAGDLCSWVFERYPEARLEGEGERQRESRRPPAEGGLLHRLDYETSGLVLFARDAEAFASLQGQQERGSFRKDYLAFSTASSELRPEGSLPPAGFPGSVPEAAWAAARAGLDLPALIALLRAGAGAGTAAGEGPEPRAVSCAFRSYGPRGSKVACVAAEAKASRPVGPAYRSELLECSAAGGAVAALRIGLTRGFRHQIRSQLAWIGLPILGDTLYGGGADERLRLYAVRLSFAHPRTGEAISLSAGGPVVAFSA